MKRLKSGIAAASIPIALLSGPVFAAQDCSAYIPSINKQMANHLAAAGPRAMKNVSLDEFGNMVDHYTIIGSMTAPFIGKAKTPPHRLTKGDETLSSTSKEDSRSTCL